MSTTDVLVVTESVHTVPHAMICDDTASSESDVTAPARLHTPPNTLAASPLTPEQLVPHRHFIHSVPPECLILILLFLPPSDLFLNAAIVSRAWHAATARATRHEGQVPVQVYLTIDPYVSPDPLRVTMLGAFRRVSVGLGRKAVVGARVAAVIAIHKAADACPQIGSEDVLSGNGTEEGARGATGNRRDTTTITSDNIFTPIKPYLPILSSLPSHTFLITTLDVGTYTSTTAAHLSCILHLLSSPSISHVIVSPHLALLLPPPASGHVRDVSVGIAADSCVRGTSTPENTAAAVKACLEAFPNATTLRVRHLDFFTHGEDEFSPDPADDDEGSDNEDGQADNAENGGATKSRRLSTHPIASIIPTRDLSRITSFFSHILPPRAHPTISSHSDTSAHHFAPVVRSLPGLVELGYLKIRDNWATKAPKMGVLGGGEGSERASVTTLHVFAANAIAPDVTAFTAALPSVFPNLVKLHVVMDKTTSAKDPAPWLGLLKGVPKGCVVHFGGEVVTEWRGQVRVSAKAKAEGTGDGTAQVKAQAKELWWSTVMEEVERMREKCGGDGGVARFLLD